MVAIRHLTVELTGRGEQNPNLKANYQLKNEVSKLRSNDLFDSVL